MNICPRCQKTYAVDNLNYCLDDGTNLTEHTDDTPPTVMLNRADDAAELGKCSNARVLAKPTATATESVLSSRSNSRSKPKFNNHFARSRDFCYSFYLLLRRTAVRLGGSGDRLSGLEKCQRKSGAIWRAQPGNRWNRNRGDRIINLNYILLVLLAG